MNIIEKQTELGKSLYQINTATLTEIATLTRNNIEKYLETNRSFGEKLPEVRDPSTFFSLQREYGETLWNNAREAFEAQNTILKGAFSDTRDALQSAFSSEVEAAPAKVKKPAAKKATA